MDEKSVEVTRKLRIAGVQLRLQEAAFLIRRRALTGGAIGFVTLDLPAGSYQGKDG